jgi:serine/threonine protein kinase
MYGFYTGHLVRSRDNNSETSETLHTKLFFCNQKGTRLTMQSPQMLSADEEFEREMALLRQFAPKVEVSAPVITYQELTYIKKLGEGGYGEVWEGRCRGQPCAIKMLSNFTFTFQQQEFKSEVEIMCQNNNPYSVLCLGAMTEREPWAMITQFMEHGDLYQCLHKSESTLSPDRKMRMLVDISMGMSWLCGEAVRTFHRDLKPQNILVDENWRCKIADYGVSFLVAKVGNMGAVNQHGTTFWNSYEVLSNGTVSEKSDVYSFALILWEMASGVPLEVHWAHYIEAREEFEKDIKEGVRPDLKLLKSPFQNEGYVDLIKRCWHVDPDQRPTFVRIISELEAIRTNIFLPPSLCPDAAKLWQSHFRGRSKVELDSFLNQICEFLQTPQPIRRKIKTGICKLYFDHHHHKAISIIKFSNLLKWFGPLKGTNGSDFVMSTLDLMKRKWFFGLINGPDASERLSSQKPGSFLVRLNNGANMPIEENPYTISFVDSEGEVKHSRILSRSGGLKCSMSDYSVKAKTLAEVVAKLQEHNATDLSEICPGSPFDFFWKFSGMPAYLPTKSK